MSLRYLFTRPDYISVNSDKKVEGFNFEGNSLFFTLADKIAFCPFQSSFALFSEKLDSKTLDEFVSSLEGKVDSIRFILPPDKYKNSRNHLIELSNYGFKINRVELVQALNISGEFRKQITSRYKNLLNKLHRLNAQTRKLGLIELPECYSLLENNRALKGYEMTMSQEKVSTLMTSFPEEVLLYGTYVENELVACSITIKVSDEVLYQFAWGHKSSFDRLSPLIFHNEQIFNEAKEKGFKEMDLGSCSQDGVINRGVYRFKKHLGARLSKKYYLEYKF